MFADSFLTFLSDWRKYLRLSAVFLNKRHYDFFLTTLMVSTVRRRASSEALAFCGSCCEKLLMRFGRGERI
jgi:hypothetical protein